MGWYRAWDCGHADGLGGSGEVERVEASCTQRGMVGTKAVAGNTVRPQGGLDAEALLLIIPPRLHHSAPHVEVSCVVLA